MIRLRSLASDTMVYGLLSAARSMVGLLLMPIYTRVFLPGDYGQIDTLNTVVAFLTLTLTLGMDTAVALFFYDNQGKEDRANMLTTSITTRIGLSTLSAILLSVAAPWISMNLFRTPDAATAICLAAWTAPVTALVGFLSELLRLERRPWIFSAVSLFNLLIGIVFSIWFVVGLQWGVNGALGAPLVASVLVLPVVLWINRDLFATHMSITWLKQLLRVGLPLVPAAFGGWLIAYANRYFLLYYASSGAVGLLAVGNKASAPLVLFTQAFLFAWGPFAFSLQKQSNAREIYAKTFTYFWLIAGTLGLAVSLYARELLWIVTTPAYVDGYLVTGFMVLQLLADCSYYIVSIGLVLARKTERLAISVPIAAAGTILFNWLLVPRFGFVGAGFAGMLSYTLLAGLAYSFAQSAYPIPFEIGRVARLVTLAVVIWFVGYWLAPPALLPALALKTALFALFVWTLFMARVVSPTEIRQLSDLGRQMLMARLG